ncbi:MAG: YkgJ family cysteine cluster protein [Thermodesulfobacteriota bacterium]
MMNDNLLFLSMDDSFQFNCDNSLSCFNTCCRNLNQLLTPYDILRIKRRLGLSSNRFLEEFVTVHIGPRSGLPIASLRPRNEQLLCPFVEETGCSIYEDRPTSCRLYPLARGISRDRKTGRITEQFALMTESFCLGAHRAERRTVREWIVNQELLMYIQFNDLLMEMIYLKNLLRPGPLDLKERDLFILACYDIDNFRDHFKKSVVNGSRSKTGSIQESTLDEEAFLKTSLEWVKTALFGGT